MNHQPQKRTASEPVVALLGQGQDPVLPQRRPFTTSLGAVLVLLRGLSGAVFFVTIVLLWQDIEPEIRKEITGIDTQALYLIFVILSAVTVVGLMLLVLLVWRGNNFARVITMVWLTLSIVVAAVGYFTLGEKITFQTSLVMISLDVLVLLALSSRDSRAWSRMSKTDRQAVLQSQRTQR